MIFKSKQPPVIEEANTDKETTSPTPTTSTTLTELYNAFVESATNVVEAAYKEKDWKTVAFVSNILGKCVAYSPSKEVDNEPTNTTNEASC